MIIFLGVMIFFIIKNKKLKSHKSYTNILYSGLAFLVFIVCFLFIAGTPGAPVKIIDYIHYEDNNNNLIQPPNQEENEEWSNDTTDDIDDTTSDLEQDYTVEFFIDKLIIVSVGGVAISMLLIFGTYKSQYVLDVKRQIKAEENGQVIERYNQNIQVTNGQPQAQNEYKEEKAGKTQSTPTRTIPPLPPEIKTKLEQNKKEDDTQ